MPAPEFTDSHEEIASFFSGRARNHQLNDEVKEYAETMINISH